MSAERTILQYLSKIQSKHAIRHSGIRLGFFGLPDFKYYKYQTMANGCSGLKKKGYVKEINGEYFITYKGQEFLDKNIKDNFKKFTSHKTDKDPKNLLIIYDIPENKKSEREWFRRELRHFNFIMIQKSVWIGPSPLPKEFVDYVKSIGLKDDFKTFRLTSGYNLTKE
jgi:DNA-binding transcriptional regulator PaaX